MRWIAAVALVLMLAPAASGQDFSTKTTPACTLAGIVARPPAGWFNVPIDSPPSGHLGCQMMRVNDEEQLVGILRVRSVTAPAREYSARSDAALIEHEREAIRRMNVEVGVEPLWTREDVPLRGAGFRDARAAGYVGTIPGQPVPQEVHFLTFRAERAIYLATLITPAKRNEPAMYKRNTDDFGTVIRTLTVEQ